MSSPQPTIHQPTIHRLAEFDIDAAALWDLVTDPDGLGAWLGDFVAIDLRPGGVGVVDDDGVVREVLVDTVDATSGTVAFTWWPADAPGTASTVRFDIVTLPEDRSRLEITETFVGAITTASASINRSRWEVRVLSLWACTVAAALAR